MHVPELFLIAVGLSMDAGAAAICKGLSIPGVRLSHGIIIGTYFGIFQALMPLIGYILGIHFLDVIGRFDHWIAFLLLALIGCMMIHESRQPEENMEMKMEKKAEEAETETKLHISEMLLLAIATSMDALITGITFAILNIRIFPAACLIGITTFLFSVLCVLAGSRLGTRFHAYAGLIGGILLILMGFRMLLRHLYFL